MRIWIIDHYDSFTYNLVQQLQTGLIKQGFSPNQLSDCCRVVQHDAVSINDLHYTFETQAPTGFILSPGPGHPANPKDFSLGHQIIDYAESHSLPLLGVCLGHQGLLQHYGAKIIQAPELVHGKTSLIQVLQGLDNQQMPYSSLLKDMTSPFEAMRYHSLVAERDSIPDCFWVTAETIENKIIMAVQHKILPFYGVQFHPESIGTPLGSKLVENFLSLNLNQKTVPA
jgi:anthranilate synthase/aminodeoxychorismate synthase-like glutamine amidotransferase